METSKIYADISLLDKETAKDLFSIIKNSFRSKSENETNNQEQKEVVFHIHFPGTKELYEILKKKYPYTQHAYCDIFCDTRNFDLIHKGLWFKQRYEYNYEEKNPCLPLICTSLKTVHRGTGDIPVTYKKLLEETISEYKKSLRRFASFDFIRYDFKTEFGSLWIEEAVFQYEEGYLFATAVVNNTIKFEDFCHNNPIMLHLLSLAPVGSKVVEYIRSLQSQKIREADELWKGLIKSRTITTSYWSSEVCQFNPRKERPITGNDEFWRRPAAWIVPE